MQIPAYILVILITSCSLPRHLLPLGLSLCLVPPPPLSVLVLTLCYFFPGSPHLVSYPFCTSMALCFPNLSDQVSTNSTFT